MVFYISKKVCELSESVNIYSLNTMAGAVIFIVADYDEISIPSTLVVSASLQMLQLDYSLLKKRNSMLQLYIRNTMSLFHVSIPTEM